MAKRGLLEWEFWFLVKAGCDDDACWEWEGYRNNHGYGLVIFDGERQGVHRVAYKLEVGSIPEGFEIDHLCNHRGCCNPAHLEAVTPEENMRRRVERQTHCKHGHEFTPENIRSDPHGRRSCRECSRIGDRRRYWAAKISAGM